MAYSKNGSRNGVGTHNPRSDVLAASIVANVLLVLLLGFWATQNSRRDSARLVGQLSKDVQDVARYIEGADRSLEQRQVQERATQAGLEDARKALGEQTGMLEAVAALRGKLKELQEGLQAQAFRGGLAWLTIGIPTFPRKDNADYLTRTLETLLEELPADDTDPLFARVRVLVMNNSPGNHSVFDKVRERMEAKGAEEAFAVKGKVYVTFMDNPGSMPDPAPDAPEPDDKHNPKNIPGREVRKQTAHLITLMELAAPMAHYHLFMEDDFRVCPNMLRIVGYIVRKLNAVPQTRKWLAVRLSYGMNGILMPSMHLSNLADYMRPHVARLPADLLWVEWTRGQNQGPDALGRSHSLYIYSRNLLDHLGQKSSFSVRVDRLPFPRCFDSMADVWSLDPRERFKQGACPNSDLSPCPGGDGGESWTRHPIQWPTEIDDDEIDHPSPVPMIEQSDATQ